MHKQRIELSFLTSAAIASVMVAGIVSFIGLLVLAAAYDGVYAEAAQALVPLFYSVVAIQMIVFVYLSLKKNSTFYIERTVNEDNAHDVDNI